MNPLQAYLDVVRRTHRIDRVAELLPLRLEVEPRIRKLCEDNLCGQYGLHPMCPPAVGTLQEAATRLERFGRGVLFQTTFSVTATDREATRVTRCTFQEATLALEGAVREHVDPEAWGLVGGSCALCSPCPARDGGACLRGDDARPSLEALGVDVVSLQEAVGWDAAFHDDRVTWTGALLWSPR